MARPTWYLGAGAWDEPSNTCEARGVPRTISPQPYTGAGATRMTVGRGRTERVASNVATGVAGGVHWSTDNTRSLRLGELVAVEVLRKRSEQ